MSRRLGELPAKKPPGAYRPQALPCSYCRDVSVLYEDRGEEIRVHAPALNAEGMFLNTSRFIPEGAMLKLRFLLSRTGEEIRARAAVRYCLPGLGLSVRFVEIDEHSRAAIAREIKQLQPPRS